MIRYFNFWKRLYFKLWIQKFINADDEGLLFMLFWALLIWQSCNDITIFIN